MWGFYGAVKVFSEKRFWKMLLDIETMTMFNCVTSYGMELGTTLLKWTFKWLVHSLVFWMYIQYSLDGKIWGNIKYVHSRFDWIECWKQRPFFFSPKEMKCVVKFSCSLVGGTSSFQLLFLLVLLLFVSHLLEAIPVASILSLSIIHSSLQCAPGKPQQPPPHRAPS